MRCNGFRHNVDGCLHAEILRVWQSHARITILSLPTYNTNSRGYWFVLSSVVSS